MNRTATYLWGVGLAILLTFTARILVQLPGLHILGTMVTAILLGILFRTANSSLPTAGQNGINFTAKTILRAGIILMGVRLNFADILAAGWQTLVLIFAVILFAITVIRLFGRAFSVEDKLATLIAVGTGVCGAAAIGGIAPVIQAKERDVALSVTIIALLGTVFTIAYTALAPFLGLSAQTYGTFSGATLHELAHVIAAAAPAGEISSQTAIVVKLGRVAFLAPIALVFGWLYAKKDQAISLKTLPIPWFILGFLFMSGLNSYALIPHASALFLENSGSFLLTMAMAAMGLNVKLSDFRQIGYTPLLIGLGGSFLLSTFGWLLISLLHL